MLKQFYRDAFGWGFILWLIGYELGMALFYFVSADEIGYLIWSIVAGFALWAAFKKIKGGSLRYYFALAAVWTLMAAALDYIFLVKAFMPDYRYYLTDVRWYYALMFIIPAFAGLVKFKKMK